MARKKKSLLNRKKTYSAKITSGTKKSLKSESTLSRKLLGKSVLLEKQFINARHNFCKKGQKDVSCKELNDSELILTIKNKDREAYRELFLRYYKKLFTYVFHLIGNRDETEDILQNVFSKTYRNIKNFDTSRKFSSWIYRIAHNEAVNFLKRRSKRFTVSWEDISTSKDKLNTATNDELPENKLMHSENNREVDIALKKLPKKYQQILRLRYFQELSYEEIGLILGKPVNTVGTLINRAKKKLLGVVKKQENR